MTNTDFEKTAQLKMLRGIASGLLEEIDELIADLELPAVAPLVLN